MISTTGRSGESRPMSGFTLIELALVMAIACLMMAAAAPSLSRFLSGRKSANAAAQLLALADYARARAAGEGITCRLNIDESRQIYWITEGHAGAFAQPGNEYGSVFSLPAGVRVSWKQTGAAGQEGKKAAAGKRAEEAVKYLEFFADGRIAAEPVLLSGSASDCVEILCRSETEPLEIVAQP